MLDTVRRHVRPLAYADTSRIPQLLEERVPGGAAIVWALTAGAEAYAAWRVLQALSNLYGVGTDPLAILKRVA